MDAFQSSGCAGTHVLSPNPDEAEISREPSTSVGEPNSSARISRKRKNPESSFDFAQALSKRKIAKRSQLGDVSNIKQMVAGQKAARKLDSVIAEFKSELTSELIHNASNAHGVEHLNTISSVFLRSIRYLKNLGDKETELEKQIEDDNFFDRSTKIGRFIHELNYVITDGANSVREFVEGLDGKLVGDLTHALKASSNLEFYSESENRAKLKSARNTLLSFANKASNDTTSHVDRLGAICADPLEGEEGIYETDEFTKLADQIKTLINGKKSVNGKTFEKYKIRSDGAKCAFIACVVNRNISEILTEIAHTKAKGSQYIKDFTKKFSNKSFDIEGSLFVEQMDSDISLSELLNKIASKWQLIFASSTEDWHKIDEKLIYIALFRALLAPDSIKGIMDKEYKKILKTMCEATSASDDDDSSEDEDTVELKKSRMDAESCLLDFSKINFKAPNAKELGEELLNATTFYHWLLLFPQQNPFEIFPVLANKIQGAPSRQQVTKTPTPVDEMPSHSSMDQEPFSITISRNVHLGPRPTLVGAHPARQYLNYLLVSEKNRSHANAEIILQAERLNRWGEMDQQVKIDVIHNILEWCFHKKNSNYNSEIYDLLHGTFSCCRLNGNIEPIALTDFRGFIKNLQEDRFMRKLFGLVSDSILDVEGVSDHHEKRRFASVFLKNVQEQCNDDQFGFFLELFLHHLSKNNSDWLRSMNWNCKK